MRCAVWRGTGREGQDRRARRIGIQMSSCGARVDMTDEVVLTGSETHWSLCCKPLGSSRLPTSLRPSGQTSL